MIADILLSIEIGILLVIDRHLYGMEKQIFKSEQNILSNINHLGSGKK